MPDAPKSPSGTVTAALRPALPTPPGPLVVGVTGHRPNRLHVGVDTVARRLAVVLCELRRGARRGGRGRPWAVSSLAEGTDRLFAETAATLGYRLTALLPLARDAYETTFADQAATAHYRALLLRAAEVRELSGSLADTKSAYEAAGRALVDASDIVIAVWDGRPAAGRGGTPEIVGYASSGRKPVIWVDAQSDRPPRLLGSPCAHGGRPVTLDSLARRARPLTRRRLARMAAGRR